MLVGCNSSEDSVEATERTADSPAQLAQAEAPASENKLSKPMLTLVGDASASLPDTVSPEQADTIEESFRLAIEKSKQNQVEQAQEIYTSLIDQYPKVIESYVNLAALYADRGELEKAANTINQGVSNSPRSTVVFDALKKLNSAVAANAYSSALNEKQKIDRVQIASLASLSQSSLDQADAQKLQGFQTRLNKVNEYYAKQLMESRRGGFEKQREVASLKGKVATLEGALSDLKSTSSVALQNTRSEMQQQIDLIKQQSETDLKDRARTVGNLQMELISLRNQLEDAEAQLVAATKQNQELLASTQVVSASETINIATASVASQPSNSLDSRVEPVIQNETVDVTSAQSEAIVPIVEFDPSSVVELVQGWAKAWSNQDVQSYINYYQAGYRPKRKNLSHNQWRQQRQIRLTNKRFIDVQVSDIVVDDLGDKLSVTFRQHYRSDTLDDRIIKRLVFAKNESGSENAKIIDELVL